MAVRSAVVVWKGPLKSGKGSFTVGSETVKGTLAAASRFDEDQANTNPEELIGAAHAACFSMALVHALEQAGYDPQSLETTARVSLVPLAGGGYAIPSIELETHGQIPNIELQTFERIADEAKDNCPVSKALAGVTISLDCHL